MIITTKTGVLVEGELAKEPVFKAMNNGTILMTLNVRYFSEKSESGKWLGKFIDVNVWRADEDILTGMLVKGNHIMATGSKIENKEFNGKTYYSLNTDAQSVYAPVMCNLEWLQQAINMIYGDTSADEPQPDEEPHEQRTAESWPTAAERSATVSAPAPSPSQTSQRTKCGL